MLETQDKKYLESFVSDKAAKLHVTLLIVGLILILCGLLSIALAFYIGHRDGYSAGTLLSEMAARPDVDREYPGVLVAAAERMTTGVMELICGTLHIMKWYFGRRERARNQRVVNALKQSGAW